MIPNVSRNCATQNGHLKNGAARNNTRVYLQDQVVDSSMIAGSGSCQAEHLGSNLSNDAIF